MFFISFHSIICCETTRPWETSLPGAQLHPDLEIVPPNQRFRIVLCRRKSSWLLLRRLVSVKSGASLFRAWIKEIRETRFADSFAKAMWKPGASKPSSSFAALAEPSSASTPRHQQAGRGGTSHPRAAPESNERDSQVATSSAAKSPSEPLRTKALSGATLNMRFMKRGAAEPSANAPAGASNRKSPQRLADSAGKRAPASPSRKQSATGTPKSAVASLRFLQDDESPRPGAPPVDDRNDDVEMSEAMEDHEMEDGESDQEEDGVHDNSNITTPQHRGVLSLVLEEATPADMHGGRGNLLGRRSFGKFNPSAEANWNAALRHAGGGDGDDVANGGSGRRKKKQQQRGRTQEERPIGNLASKMPRSHSNNSRGHSQGKKRKTMISDVS